MCQMCDEQDRNDTSETPMIVADSDAARAAMALKPMSTAPRVPILAVHYERGPLEIAPCHEANWWLAYAQPGVGHWYVIDDEEGGMLDDEEFDGWIAECAE